MTAETDRHPPVPHDYCLHAEDWGAVKADLGHIQSKLDRIIGQTETSVERLRSLEDWRNRQTGALAVVGFFAGAIGAGVMLLVKLWMGPKS